MARRASKRTPKLPGNLEGFVDGEEHMLLIEDKWAVVQFEDEGRLYAVVPISDVRPILPDDDSDFENGEFENGDYVEAIWPGDGKPYEAVFLDCGPKLEMRALRSKFEKEAKAKTKGKENKLDQGKAKKTLTITNTEKAAEEKRKAAEEKKKAAEEKKKAAEEKKKAAEEKRKAAEEKKRAAEEERKAAKRKPEEDAREKTKLEAKRRREEAKQKRAAELEQAKENAAYFRTAIINIGDEECSEEEINDLPQMTENEDFSDDSECGHCLILQEKIKKLERTLSEVKQELQVAKQRASELSGNQGACSTTKGKPGVMTPEEAAKLGMVPLVPGSHVFLYQEQKNACYAAQPTKLCRNLVRVFFDMETLKLSNYAGGGKKGRPALNMTITEAIIGYCTDPQVIKHGQIETASRIAETIGKCCAEARRGISKLS